MNALHLSSKEGHLNIVKELLKRGANVDAATKVKYYTKNNHTKDNLGLNKEHLTTCRAGFQPMPSELTGSGAIRLCAFYLEPPNKDIDKIGKPLTLGLDSLVGRAPNVSPEVVGSNPDLVKLPFFQPKFN